MIRVPSLSSDDVDAFIADYFPAAGPTLLIGNLGFSADVLYFPERMGQLPVLLPVCPRPVVVLVVHQLEQVGRHPDPVAHDTRALSR